MAASGSDIPATAVIPKTCRERFLDLKPAFALPLRQRGIEMAGISDLRPPYEIGRPRAPCHVVSHTLEGTGRYNTPDCAGTFTPGMLWIGPAGGAHQYVAGKRWRIAWFHLADDARWSHLRSAGPIVRRGGTDELVAAMEGYISEAVSAIGAAAHAAELYAELVGIHLDRELEPDDDPAALRVRRELDALWSQVHADLAHAWTVDDLAARVHVSPVQLHRLTHRFMGATPMGVVTRLRMQRAEGLLRHTDYPLKLIADLVGYETPFAFSRAFKRHAGASPKRYRESGRIA